MKTKDKFNFSEKKCIFFADEKPSFNLEINDDKGWIQERLSELDNNIFQDGQLTIDETKQILDQAKDINWRQDGKTGYVAALQVALKYINDTKKANCDPGTLDSIMKTGKGEGATKQALMRFQEWYKTTYSQDIEADGEPGPKSVQALLRVLDETETVDINKRKAGVLAKVQELGGTNLDDNLIIEGLTFEPYEDDKNMDDATWSQNGKFYERVAIYNGVGIWIDISITPPHNYYGNGGTLLADSAAVVKDVKDRKVEIDKWKTEADKRKAGVLAKVKELGGEKLDDNLIIEGLTFEPSTDDYDDKNGNLTNIKDWNDDPNSYWRAVKYKGVDIFFGIDVKPPHGFYVADKDKKAISLADQAAVSKYIKDRKAEIDEAKKSS